MEQRESTERKNLFIKTIVLVILLLLSFLATILYVFAYPKTTVVLYNAEYQVAMSFDVKKHSKLKNLPKLNRPGYTFREWVDENGYKHDEERDLTEDELRLYPVYDKNQYTITYHVQVLNPLTGEFDYRQDVAGCMPETEYFNEKVQLPTGRDKDDNLLPEFKKRLGNSFVGWATKVFDEDAVVNYVLAVENPNVYAEVTLADKSVVIIYKPGAQFSIPAGDVDLFAIWEKNRYTVELYSGNEYQFDGGNTMPTKDANGKFIIRNNRIHSLASIRYLDYLSKLTDAYMDITLDSSLDGDGAEEYDFLGWYLDPEFTIKASDYMMEVRVSLDDVPYLRYKDGNEVKSYNSHLNENGEYVFRLYSKWERHAYTITFDKNTNRSNSKIEPIKIYKYDDNYGRFYNEGSSGNYTNVSDFNYANMHSGVYYNYIDLSDVDITTDSFKNSNGNGSYRFMGWTTRSNASEKDNVWYYQWTQNQDKSVGYANSIEYTNKTYRHTISEDITLYAQWSKVYTVTFADSYSFNKKTFTQSGVEGEWIQLDGLIEIASRGWSKDYNTFIGWTNNPNSSSADKWLESLNNGEKNPDYTYTFKRSNVALYVLWERDEYEIKFYVNYGTENGGKGKEFTTMFPAYGGTSKNYPSAPTRDGYIFKGWSETQYVDNDYEKKLKNNNFGEGDLPVYTSSKSFRVVGDAEYYATWTKNFTIIYDANGGQGVLPTSKKYSENFQNLIMQMQLGSGNRLTRDGYNFIGWGLKNPETGELYDYTFKSSTGVVFDFDGMQVYVANYPNSKYSVELESLSDDDIANKLVLYAKWQIKEYYITLIDTKNNSSTEKITVEYKQENFTLPDENYLDGKYLHEGVKLLGWSNSKNATSVTIDAGGMIPAEDLIRDYTFYTVYEAKQITILYKIIREDGSVVDYNPSSSGGYSKGKVNYNTKLNLPTPSASDYGNVNFKFNYWYYEDDSLGEIQKVRINSGDMLRYEGETLILYSEFMSLNFKINFVITEPSGYRPIEDIKITKVVDKGSTTGNVAISDPLDLYDEIMLALEEFISTNEIKEFSCLGFFNTYFGNGALNPLKFAPNMAINGVNFPYLAVSNEITFTTMWEANAVDIIYYSGEDKAQDKDNVYSNVTYSSTETLAMPSANLFDLGNGIEINSWYIKDSEGNKLYFDVTTAEITSYLIGDKYTGISDLAQYIEWENVGGVFRGKIEIFAETHFVFDVNYYRYSSNGTLEKIGETKNYIYSDQTDYTLEPSDFATYGDLTFNGWRIGSLTSSQILPALGTLDINATDYPDYEVNVYADMSYRVTMRQWNMIMGTLVEDEIYSYTNNYYDLNTGLYIDSIKITECPEYTGNLDNYTYFGIRHGDRTVDKATIERDGMVVNCDGNNINLLVYLTKNITITYNVSNGETFDGLVDSQVVQQLNAGFDNTSAENFKVGRPNGNTADLLIANKPGYVFVGWTIGVFTQGSQVYTNDTEMPISEDIDFYAYFEKPEKNTIEGKIIYLKNTGDNTPSYVEVVKNGIPTELLSGEEIESRSPNADSWTSNTMIIRGWLYNGVEYPIGFNFQVPEIMVAGTEYVFKAVWVEEYTLTFNAGVVATGVPENTKLERGEIYLVSGKPEALTEGNTFSYWTFALDSSRVSSQAGIEEFYENGVVKISVGDRLVFVSSNNKYRFTSDLVDGITHYIPVTDNIWGYTLMGVWDKASYTLTLHITNPNKVSEDLPTSGVLTTNPYIITVKYGDKLDPRGSILLPDSLKAQLESGNSIITGWGLTRNATESLEDLLTGITEDLELYSIWSTKYTLTYATANESFGYINKDTNVEITPETEYFYKGQIYSFNTDVMYSVYRKGYHTIYFTDGGYKVYSPSECGNEYYALIGYTISYSNGQTIEHLFDISGDTFTALDSNATLIPIIEKYHKVDFYYNLAGKPTTPIADFEMFVINNGSITSEDLRIRNLVSENFTFLGWYELGQEPNPISGISNITSNKTLNAVWQSDVGATFVFNGDQLFKINLNNTMKLVEQDVTTAFNNKVTSTPINGNSNVYTYAGTMYYLQGFVYRDASGVSNTYSLSDLCNIEFTGNVTILVSMTNVYTITFDPNADDYEGTPNASMYIVNTGAIMSAGIRNFVLPVPSVIRTYYTANSWIVGSGQVGAFTINANTEVSELELSTLVGFASGTQIILKCNWTPRSYEIYVNFGGIDLDGDIVSGYNPYNDYKNYADAESLVDGVYATPNKYNNVFVLSSDNIRQSTAGILSMPYDSKFKLTTKLNSVDSCIYGDYTLIGWSTTPLKLGEITDGYYSINKDGISAIINLDENNIKNGYVNLYPVFRIITKTITINTNNGSASVLIDNNSLLTGFVHNNRFEDSYTVTGSENVSVAYYNSVTVIADSPVNKNYEFDSFEGLGVNSVVDNQSARYVETATTGTINVNYKPIEFNLQLELVYTDTLISGTDTSYFTVNGNTINQASPSKTIVIAASTGVLFDFVISEYFRLVDIRDINNDIYSLGASITIDSLVRVGDNAKLKFTLAPKSHTLTFYLNGGTLSTTTLNVSNEIYTTTNLGTSVDIESDTVVVYAGTEVTLPSVTRSGFEFICWIDGSGNEFTTDITVADDTVLTARYNVNTFTLTYRVLGQPDITVSFSVGDTIYVGQGVVCNVVGKEITGWTRRIGSTITTYTIGQELRLTDKFDYLFEAVLEGKDVTLVYNYLNADGSSATQTVAHTWGEDILALSETDLGQDVENKYIYEWQFNGNSLRANNMSKISFGSLGLNAYQDTIELDAIYYNEYKYNITYVLGDSDTTIESDTAYAYANAISGNIGAGIWYYTVSIIEPINNVNTQRFAGYTLSINGELVKDNGVNVIYSLGELIALDIITTPGIVLEYNYVLTATWENTNEAKDLSVFITNPLNGSNYTLSIGESFNTTILITQKLTPKFVPNIVSIDSNVNWKVDISGVEFTTTKVVSNEATHKSIEQWHLLGYRIYGYIGAERTEITSENNILTMDSIFGLAIAGYERYEAYTVWERKINVKYFDDNGNNIVDKYVIKGTRLEVVSGDRKIIDESGSEISYDFSKANYDYVGVSTTQDKKINVTSDFYAFGTTITINDVITFYPAFVRNYNVKLDFQLILFGNKGGDVSKITAGNDADINNIVIGTINILNPTINLTNVKTEYQLGYKGDGFKINGFSRSRGFFGEESVTTIESYTLNATDANQASVSGIITIYVIWERSGSEVVLQHNAYTKNGQLLSSEKLTINAKYGEIISLYNNATIENFVATLEGNYAFVEFANYTLDASKQNVVTEVTASTTQIIVYINYTYIYSLKYELTAETSLVGEPLPNQIGVGVGSAVSYYSVENVATSRVGNVVSMWSLDGVNNFFATKPHVISEADLNKADNNYTIILRPVITEKTYKVTIRYFLSAEDLVNNTYSETNIVEFRVNESIEQRKSDFRFNGLTWSEMEAISYSPYVLSDFILVNEQLMQMSQYRAGENDSDIITLQYNYKTLNITFGAVVVDANDSYQMLDRQGDFSGNYSLYNLSTGEIQEWYFTGVSVVRQVSLNEVIIVGDISTFENNSSLNFVGWRTASRDGNGTIVAGRLSDIVAGQYGFAEYKPTTIAGYNGYYDIVVSDDTFIYAVFEYKKCDVTITITSDTLQNSDLENFSAVVLNEYDEIVNIGTPTIVGSEKVYNFSVPMDTLLTVSGEDLTDKFTILVDGVENTNNILVSNTTGTTEISIIFNYIRKYVYVDTLGAQLTKLPFTLNGLGYELDSKYIVQGIYSTAYGTANYRARIPLTAVSTEPEVDTNSLIGMQDFSWTKYNLEDEDVFWAITGNRADVTITYVLREADLTQGMTELVKTDTFANGFGSEINLRNLVIENSLAISNGWIIDNREYTLGQEFTLNKTHYIVYPKFIDKYTVTYTNPDDPEAPVFNLSGYTNQTLGSSEISITGAHSYVEITSANTYEIVDVNNSYTYLTTSFEIPNISIPDTTKKVGGGDIGYAVAFSRFTVDRESYTRGSIYSLKLHHAVDRVVSLVAMSSSEVVLKFYLTSPTNTTNDSLKLVNKNGLYIYQVKPTVSSTNYLDYIEVNFDNKESVYNGPFPNYYLSQGGDYIQWFSSNSARYSHYDETLFEDYSFVGWKTISGDVVVMYQVINGKFTAKINANSENNISNSVRIELTELIKSGNLEFYAVFEKKVVVSFDASDSSFEGSFVESAKGMPGEKIIMPNPTTHSLTNGNRAWIGWGDDVENPTIAYYFSNSIEMNILDSNLTLYPLWTEGAKIKFDVNFNLDTNQALSLRDYYAQVLKDVNPDTNETKNKTGYPILQSNDYNLRGDSTSLETINEYDFYKIYYVGSYMSAGSRIIMDNLTFNHNYTIGKTTNSIYYLANVDSEYFEVTGWKFGEYTVTSLEILEIIEDGSGRQVKLLLNDEINITADGENIVIKAMWKPVDVTVSYYQDKESTYAYKYNNSPITLTVPFGSKVHLNSTIDSSITKENNIIYTYIYNPSIGTTKSNLEKYYSNGSIVTVGKWRFRSWYLCGTNDNLFIDVSTATVSSYILGDINIYPKFDEEFLVKFTDKQSNQDLGINKYNSVNSLINGDVINIKEALGGWYGYVNTKQYKNNIPTEVSITSDEVALDISVFKLEGTGQTSSYTADYRYVNIYLTFKDISIETYANPDDPYTKTEHKISPLLVYQVVDNPYFRQNPSLGTLTFAGWVRSNNNLYENNDTATDIHNLKSVKVESVRLLCEGDAIKLCFNCDETGKGGTTVTLTTVGEKIAIKLFAQFVSETEVSLPSGAQEYASIEIDVTGVSDYVKNVEAITVGNTIIGYRYVSAYNSPKTPVVKIYGLGYSVHTMYQNDVELVEWSNEPKNITSNAILTTETFNYTHSKQNEIKLDGTDNKYLLVTESLNIFNNVLKENAVIKLNIMPLVFNVYYEYNPNDITPTYSESPIVFNAFPEIPTGETSITGNITFAQQKLFIDDSNVTYYEYNFERKRVSETLEIITISNVLYGTSLYVGATPVTTGTVNFAGWAQKVVTDNNHNFNMYAYYQKLTALETDNTIENYLGHYTLVAETQTHEIDEIVFEIVFDESFYDEGSNWHTVLQNTIVGTKYTNLIIDKVSTRVNLEKYTAKDDRNKDKYVFRYTISVVDQYAGLDASIETIVNLFSEGLLNNSILTPGSIVANKFNIDQTLKYFYVDRIWKTYGTNSAFTWAGDLIVYNNDYSGSEDTTLVLYTLATKAIYLDVNHSTVDYANGTDIISLDRADMKYISNNNGTNEEYLVVGELDKNNMADSFGVIVPYDYTATISVVPDSASSDNVEYVLYSWAGINNNPVYTNEISITASNLMIDQFTSIEGYIVPHITANALVTTKTYNVNFYNSDVLIGSYPVAYDLNVYALNNATYKHYNIPTLQSMYEYYYSIFADKLPMFDLAIKKTGNKNFIPFAHPNDGDTKDKNEGQFEYIFTHWSENKPTAYGVTTNITSNINLYAYYEMCASITYAVACVGDTLLNYSLYFVPTRVITDCFGVEYTDSYYLPAILSDIKKINPNYVWDGTNAGRMYALSGNTIIPVENVSKSQELVIYPGIKCVINLDNSYYEYQLTPNTNVDKYVLSLGGLYYLNYAYTGNDASITFSNIVPYNYSVDASVSSSINGIDIVDGYSTIEKVSVGKGRADFYDNTQNRYWAYYDVNYVDYYGNVIYESIRTDSDTKIAVSSVLNISSHTNLSISSIGLDNCTWTGGSLEMNFVAVENAPTFMKFENMENGSSEDYGYRLQVTGKHQLTLVKVSESTTEAKWTITNSTEATSTIWIVEYMPIGASTYTTIMSSNIEGQYVWLQDVVGNYRIRLEEEWPYWDYEVLPENQKGIPVVNRPDLEKGGDKIVVLTAKECVYYQSVRAIIGSKVTITTGNVWSVSIAGNKLWTVDVSTLIFKENDYASSGYLHNFRIQYGNGVNAWVDIKDGDNLTIPGYRFIRLVCEWKDNDIKIQTLNNYSREINIDDNYTVENISTKAGRDNRDIRISKNGIVSEYPNAYTTIKVFAGDSFVIRGNEWIDDTTYNSTDSGTITITDMLFGTECNINQNINKDYYVQGWLTSGLNYFNPLAYESISVDTLYTFDRLVLWAENIVEETYVIVDRSEEWYGLGDVSVEMKYNPGSSRSSSRNVLGSWFEEDIYSEYTRAHSTFTERNSYIYVVIPRMGESCLVDIRASSNSTLKHKFSKFTYGDNFSSSNTICVNASQLVDNPMEVLFDARYDIAGNEIISSLSIDMVDPYYGYSQYRDGSTYINKALYDFNSYESFDIVKDIYSGHKVIVSDWTSYYQVVVWDYFEPAGEAIKVLKIYKEGSQPSPIQVGDSYYPEDGYYVVDLSGNWHNETLLTGILHMVYPDSNMRIRTNAYDSKISTNYKDVATNILGVTKFYPDIKEEIGNNVYDYSGRYVTMSDELEVNISQPGSTLANVGRVNVSLDSSGRISVTGEGVNANTGASTSVTITPNSGYQISRIYIKSRNSNAIENSYEIISVYYGESAYFDIQTNDYTIYIDIEEISYYDYSFAISLPHSSDYKFIQFGEVFYDYFDEQLVRGLEEYSLQTGTYAKFNYTYLSSGAKEFTSYADLESNSGRAPTIATIRAEKSYNGESMRIVRIDNPNQVMIRFFYGDCVAYELQVWWHTGLFDINRVACYYGDTSIKSANSTLKYITGVSSSVAYVNEGDNYSNGNCLILYDFDRVQKNIYSISLSETNGGEGSYSFNASSATRNQVWGGLAGIGIDTTNNYYVSNNISIFFNYNVIADAEVELIGRDSLYGSDYDDDPMKLLNPIYDNVSYWQGNPYLIVPVNMGDDGVVSFDWNYVGYKINLYLSDYVDWAIVELDETNFDFYDKDGGSVVTTQDIMAKSYNAGTQGIVTLQLPELVSEKGSDILYYNFGTNGRYTTGLYANTSNGSRYEFSCNTPVSSSQTVRVSAYKVVEYHYDGDKETTIVNTFAEVWAKKQNSFTEYQSNNYVVLGNSIVHVDIYPIFAVDIDRKIYIEDDKFDIFPELAHNSSYYWKGENGITVDIARANMAGDGNNLVGNYTANLKTKQILYDYVYDSNVFVNTVYYGFYQNVYIVNSSTKNYDGSSSKISGTWVFGGFRLKDGTSPHSPSAGYSVYNVYNEPNPSSYSNYPLTITQEASSNSYLYSFVPYTEGDVVLVPIWYELGVTVDYVIQGIQYSGSVCKDYYGNNVDYLDLSCHSEDKTYYDVHYTRVTYDNVISGLPYIANIPETNVSDYYCQGSGCLFANIHEGSTHYNFRQNYPNGYALSSPDFVVSKYQDGKNGSMYESYYNINDTNYGGYAVTTEPIQRYWLEEVHHDEKVTWIKTLSAMYDYNNTSPNCRNIYYPFEEIDSFCMHFGTESKKCYYCSGSEYDEDQLYSLFDYVMDGDGYDNFWWSESTNYAYEVTELWGDSHRHNRYKICSNCGYYSMDYVEQVCMPDYVDDSFYHNYGDGFYVFYSDKTGMKAPCNAKSIPEGGYEDRSRSCVYCDSSASTEYGREYNTWYYNLYDSIDETMNGVTMFYFTEKEDHIFDTASLGSCVTPGKKECIKCGYVETTTADGPHNFGQLPNQNYSSNVELFKIPEAFEDYWSECLVSCGGGYNDYSTTNVYLCGTQVWCGNNCGKSVYYATGVKVGSSFSSATNYTNQNMSNSMKYMNAFIKFMNGVSGIDWIEHTVVANYNGALIQNSHYDYQEHLQEFINEYSSSSSALSEFDYTLDYVSETSYSAGSYSNSPLATKVSNGLGSPGYRVDTNAWSNYIGVLERQVRMFIRDTFVDYIEALDYYYFNNDSFFWTQADINADLIRQNIIK